MKKIFALLALVMSIIIVSMPRIYGQINVWVHVTPDCPDICTTHENCYHYVAYEIYEICTGDPEEVCSGFKQEACEVEVIKFDNCEYDCSELPNDPCYLVVAIAYKKCVGPGGTTIICTGRGSTYVTCCHDLMNTNNDVYIEWE